MVHTYRSTNGTQENGIGVLSGIEGFVRQWRSSGIDRGLYGSCVSVHSPIDGVVREESQALTPPSR